MALRERNKDDSYISGSNMTKSSVASVGKNTNIFSNADVASSTLRHDQLVFTVNTAKKQPLQTVKRKLLFNGINATCSGSTFRFLPIIYLETFL